MTETKMTSERFKRIEELFRDVVHLNSEVRQNYLDLVCPDAEVRKEVEAMLEADRVPIPDLLTAGFPLGMKPDAEPAGWPYRSSIPGLTPGEPALKTRRDIIGPYRILNELGQGGMGTVFLAERQDIQKKVAIKQIRSSLASFDATQRFLQERRILARLDHPSIARLLDAGMTDDGAPYYVMEYVEGERITTYSDRQRLDVTQRLNLIIAVGEAVQYAHQNLVIHRDLKPSNILVTASGDVKLLDFGIAKLLEKEVEEVTHTHSRLMTPEYAAPEQIRGHLVTTATDVYSMGVLLYELLTGQKPYDVSGCSPAEIERLVCDRDPIRPSDAASHPFTGFTLEGPSGTVSQAFPDEVLPVMASRRFRGKLKGDLDTICLKALAKEPERRYPSAEALIDDIRRYIEGKPVQARPSTLWYKAAKFGRRHKTGVLLTSVLTLAIAAVIGWFTYRLARERDVARLEATKAEEVSGFLLSVFEVVDPFSVEPLRGDTVSARTLLRRGIDRIERELLNQPEVRSELLDKFGQVYTMLGLYEDAEPILQKALDLRRKLPADHRSDVAKSLNRLGYLYLQSGNLNAAERLIREALELNRRVLGNGDHEVAYSLTNLGEVFHEQGRYDEAESVYIEALAIERQISGRNHPDAVAILSNLATTKLGKGDYDSAERLYREVVRWDRHNLGNDHTNVATALNNLAHALHGKGDLEGAEQAMQEVLAINRRILGPGHPHVALGVANLGTIQLAQEKFADAETSLNAGLELAEKAFGPRHHHVGMLEGNLGLVYLATARAVRAERSFREAISIYREAFPEGHPYSARLESNLGASLTDQRRFEEAELLLLTSQRALTESYGENHRFVEENQDRIIRLYSALGGKDEQNRWQIQKDL